MHAYEMVSDLFAYTNTKQAGKKKKRSQPELGLVKYKIRHRWLRDRMES